MKPTLRVLLAALVLFISPSVKSADWQVLYEEDLTNVGHITYSVDRSTLTRHGNIVSAWLLVNYSTEQSLLDEDHEYQTYRSGKSLVYIRCRQHTLTTVIDQIYSEAMGRGTLLAQNNSIFAHDAKDLHWQSASVWPFVARQSAILCK